MGLGTPRILTGQRKSTACGLRWCKVDLIRRTSAAACREAGGDLDPVLGHAARGVGEEHYAMATLTGMRETVGATARRLLVDAA